MKQEEAFRNTKECLIRLSAKIPKMFYNNLASFMILYDHSSYYLRNALSEILANIIKYVLVSYDEEDRDN